MGDEAFFWTSNETATGAYMRKLRYEETYIYRSEGFSKEGGFSARCMTNELIETGCTNPEACNYDESANVDDGSCEYVDDDGDGICDNSYFLTGISPDNAQQTGGSVWLIISASENVYFCSEGGPGWAWPSCAIGGMWLSRQGSSNIHADYESFGKWYDNPMQENYDPSLLSGYYHIPSDALVGYWDVNVDHHDHGLMTLSDGQH
jgi:hypothetical protein